MTKLSTTTTSLSGDWAKRHASDPPTLPAPPVIKIFRCDCVMLLIKEKRNSPANHSFLMPSPRRVTNEASESNNCLHCSVRPISNTKPSPSPTSLAIASGCSVAGSIASGNRGQRRSAHTGGTVTPDLTPRTMDFQVRRPTRAERLSPFFRQANLQHQAIPFANFTCDHVRLLGGRKRCERQPRLTPIGSHRRNRHPGSHAPYDGLPSPSTHQNRTIVSIVPSGQSPTPSHPPRQLHSRSHQAAR
ncbi:hypothetical protein RB1814 [Rhodopirellula baltica SH 1]|uniref:Uncharacterized protein n=1 Tax=Rhodopirellula baltica (strain DSM 10527 / NCIMB 13988 / SH1) TaxID=243090 RepID=Q7UWT2_RHOBA|nr:hypothetical protein RB1814 [Rhodopirellula baltica SH 1]